MRRAMRICGLLACLISLATITQVAPRGAVAAGEGPTPTPAFGEFKVLFSACSPGKPAGPGLFIADADFSHAARITTARPDLPIADLQAGSVSGCDGGAWSPDGTRVAVARNMYLHMLQLSALAELPGQQPVAVMNSSGEPISVGSPVWSPDGQWIAFHDGDGLALVRPDGTGYRQLVSLSTNWYPIREPEFSPDGRSVAFRGKGAPGRIFLVTNLTGPGEPKTRELTTQKTYQDSWPHFSPDGTKLLFTRATEPHRDLQFGDVWVLDLKTGRETQFTDTPDVAEQGLGWCPFDGRIYIYESPQERGQIGSIVRLTEDGSSERFPCELTPVGRVTWANTGAWIDSVQALPGEEVTVKVGMQDAEELAEAISDIGVSGLEVVGVRLGRTIPNWTMLDPVITDDLLSLHAFAPDPRAQNVTGVAHLFDLRLGVSPQAEADELRLLTFSDLYLADRWSRPLPRLTLAGAVQTIPFAALALEVTSKTAGADGTVALRITLAALDRQGHVMRGCRTPVQLGAYWYLPTSEYETGPNAIQPTSPSHVILRDGVWSGRVTIADPLPGARLLAYYGDIAAWSEPLVPGMP